MFKNVWDWVRRINAYVIIGWKYRYEYTKFATTTTDNETEELSSEVEEVFKQKNHLLRKEKLKKKEERLAKEKEEEERREQESIEAAEKWQEKLNNPRTDVTYDNLMRTPVKINLLRFFIYFILLFYIYSL